MFIIFAELPIILSGLLIILKLALKKNLSAENTAIILLIFIGIRILGRVLGKVISHVIRLMFRLGLPIFSLYIFLIDYSKGNKSEIINILGAIISLLIIILAFYIILYPFLKK